MLAPRPPVRPMSSKITLDVLDAVLNCKLKAYLRLAGQQGVKSDYETMLVRFRQQVRQKAIENIHNGHHDDPISIGTRVTRTTLKEGNGFLLDAKLDDDCYLVEFDGLKKVDGPSALGNFHYVPVLFTEDRRIRQSHRRLLEVLSLLLSRVQGKMPRSGVVYYGHECKATTIRLTTGLKSAEAIDEDLVRMCQAETAPSLLLNEHCPVCEFRQQCHSQAVQEDNLSLLRGIGEKGIKRYARKGLFTLTQLAHTFRPRRKGKRSDRPSKQRNHALQALAIRDKTVYVFGAPNVPSDAVRIYLDLEGSPDEQFVYLIGMIVCDSAREERFSFWADSKDQEDDIFERFLAVVSRYNATRIFCYGSYERAFIKRLRRRARRKKPVDKALDALTNTLAIIYDHFYFPTYSNRLKEVAGFLGFSWSDQNASGLQSIVWRSHWERTREEHWKEKLVEYNLEDCDALRRVTEFLNTACTEMSTIQPPRVPEGTELRISRVQDLDRLADARRWGEIKFFHTDFEFVNRCAYFDYQRERVFVRTRKSRNAHVPRRRVQQNRKIRPSQQLEFTAVNCPACGETNLEPTTGKRITGAYARVKRAFDLLVTPSGVRRRIIECRATGYRCLRCGHLFVPDRYRRLAKHSHALMSWAIYQYIAYLLSLSPLKEMFREFFGLTIGVQEIHEFKSLLARYYRTTYRKLLAKIISGPVVHADETSVKLRSGTAYVWVFASLEEAVYIYKPTREGEFLREMLSDFKGVLVSDFFAAYDSLGCPQQKCLIHLMRDMNQDILDNPFDYELQSITRPFGELLRAIVSTVDDHGLKRRYLTQHARAVAEFFRSISKQSFRSETAVALRERLIKNQGKLFTFMQHDGVPWNNNCAENAIKQFAYYREGTVGVMKEAGLSDYLVLLSIYQTCRYKGVSFLKFLLSKERDVDSYCAGKRTRRHMGIELYPKGYTPPHLTFLGKQVGAVPPRDSSGSPPS
jgi:predicted RecB family nuclease